MYTCTHKNECIYCQCTLRMGPSVLHMQCFTCILCGIHVQQFGVKFRAKLKQILSTD